MSRIVMLVGMQATGKSSVARKYVNKGFVVVNRDTEGGRLSGLIDKMEEAIDQGKDVILDNTYMTKDSRRPFLQLAYNKGLSVECELMGGKIEDAQVNACIRMMERYGKILSPDELKKSNDPNMIPPVVLFSYQKQFEKPELDEGFKQINVIPFQRVWGPEFTGKAVIFDYDGTLRECKGGNGKFPCNPGEVCVDGKRAEVIRRYKDDGYLLLGASNQSGIAKGMLTEAQAITCFERTNELLGVEIDYYFCPHKIPPITCFCRKPMPGMGIHWVMKHKLNPANVIMVGDMNCDKTFAARCGFKYIPHEEFFRT